MPQHTLKIIWAQKWVTSCCKDNPVDIGRKLNVYKTFRRRHGERKKRVLDGVVSRKGLDLEVDKSRMNPELRVMMVELQLKSN